MAKKLQKTQICIDRDFEISRVDERIFGSFIEHLGRAVYEGFYQPGNKNSDMDGFRTDVISLIKEINVPLVRYPGSNFVSGFNWEDSVGPKEDRPRRIELAWGVVETNQFGLNEFMSWCKKTGISPIMTSDEGAWRQTIFYPYMHASLYGRGTVLNTIVKSPSYESKHGDAPYIDSVVTADDENETLSIFAVNKNLEDDFELTCDLRQYSDYKAVSHMVLTNEDMKAVNTEKNPDEVSPTEVRDVKIENGILTAILPSKSWNVIRLGR